MLTNTGKNKMAAAFVDSLDHASYTLDGMAGTADILSKSAAADTIKVYVFFADPVAGTLADISLVDTAGDVLAVCASAVIKPGSQGLLVAFKYTIEEVIRHGSI